MPLHALPCSLFTVNLLQLRSLTYTHAHCTRAQHSLALTRSLSLFLLQQQRSLQGPSQAHSLFSFIFPLLYFAFLLVCFTASLSLSLALMHFLVCYTGNALQPLPDAATAMQLVGADAGCAVVVAACIVFVCAQIKRNTKIKTKEKERNYCCCCFKFKLLICVRAILFLSLPLSLDIENSVTTHTYTQTHAGKATKHNKGSGSTVKHTQRTHGKTITIAIKR